MSPTTDWDYPTAVRHLVDPEVDALTRRNALNRVYAYVGETISGLDRLRHQGGDLGVAAEEALRASEERYALATQAAVEAERIGMTVLAKAANELADGMAMVGDDEQEADR